MISKCIGECITPFRDGWMLETKSISGFMFEKNGVKFIDVYNIDSTDFNNVYDNVWAPYRVVVRFFNGLEKFDEEVFNSYIIDSMKSEESLHYDTVMQIGKNSIVNWRIEYVYKCIYHEDIDDSILQLDWIVWGRKYYKEDLKK